MTRRLIFEAGSWVDLIAQMFAIAAVSSTFVFAATVLSMLYHGD